MSLTPIALSALGANLDAALTAAGVDGKWMYASPPLLAVHGTVATATAGLRLYVYDDELAKWVPSVVAVATVNPATDAGVFELRFNTASVPGWYALVQEAGTGTVSYRFHEGH